MIRTAEVIRFDRLAGTGRNDPLRVAIVTVDGVEHEAVLKPAGWKELTISSVMREYLAAAIAGLVAAPVCEPFVVTCVLELIDNIQDVAIRAGLKRCRWPAFATKHAGRQWQSWSSGDLVTPERKPEALAILALDAFLDNADRCARNPNLLVKGGKLRAIDHELAFGFVDLFAKPPPPWQLGGLTWLTEGDQRNVLWGPLRNAAGLDFAGVRAAWKGLADAELNAIVNSLPKEWGEAAATAKAAVQRVKDVRNNIDACIDELKRVLS